VAFNGDRPRIYVDGQFDAAFPLVPPGAPEKRGGLNLGVGVDPAQLLRAATPGNWHNAIRDFAAHCVGAGLPDWIIVEAARQVLDNPGDASDVIDLIRGARKKFDIPNPAAEQAESAPLRAFGLTSFIGLDLPERKTIFGPWLPEQGLAMAFSETGMGKTYFALNVAYAVATAGTYLGWQATERHKVLYLDGEMPARTMQDRSKAIAGSEPPEDLNAWFEVITPDLQEGVMPDLSTTEGQARIEPHLPGVKLVVIDHHSAFCRTGIENDAESWLPMQAWILSLRRRGISVLLIHHAGKGGMQRGTSRREDVLDTVIQLKRPKDYEPEDGARFEVHFTKHRGFAGDDAAPIEAKLITDGLGRARWEVSNMGDKLTEEIRELNSEGLSLREIAKRLGITKGKVERRLRT
jgi:putative DNA primase/helicase